MSFPLGSVIRLNRRTRVRDDGHVLIGGSPTRVMRLQPEIARLIFDESVTVADRLSAALAGRLISTGMGDPVAGTLPAVPLSALTVVVPVKDRLRQLTRLLASLPAGLAGCIVVDDGSEDRAGVAEVVRAHGAVLVPLPHNLGVAAARNAGLERVGTPYVAFVDSDAVVGAGSFEILLRHFADPDLALVAPRIVGLERSRPNWITRYENSRSSLDLGGDGGLVRPRSPITWVSGACMVARHDAIGQGFDAAMDAGEDVDLVWRLVAEGRRVRFEPSAVVYHEHRTTLRMWMQRKFFYGTGAAPLAARHPYDVAPVVLPPWGAAVLALILVQRRWSVAIALGIAVIVGTRVRRRIAFVHRPTAEAAHMTIQGVSATMAQGAALVIRHWWPVTLLASLFSRRARRAALWAGTLDAAWEYVRLRPTLDPIRFAAARRMDDFAYGAGVWWSAGRARSLRALTPRLTRTSRLRNASGRDADDRRLTSSIAHPAEQAGDG